MSIWIACLGTEDFFNEYSDTKLGDVHDYTSDVWSDEIEDGSGSYTGKFDIFTSNAVKVPHNDICQACLTLRNRVQSVDDWLSNNWGIYSTYDVIIVADYYTGGHGDNKWGVAQQTAGTSTNKCALVDFDETEDATGEWQSEGGEGLAAHELLHMFIDEPNTSEHYPKITTLGSASLMWDNSIASKCKTTYNAQTISKFVSSCTRDKVRTWIDNNM